MRNLHFQNMSILWAAPYSLHDSTSGAALQMKRLFEQLAKRGFRCHVLSALIFDTLLVAELAQTFMPSHPEQLQKEEKYIEFTENAVDYTYLKTASSVLHEMQRHEELEFYSKFQHLLEVVKPDIFFIYGGGILENFLVAECKRRGIKTAFYVPNGNYVYDTFQNVDLALTESEMTAKYYFRANRINLKAMGTFIDPKKVIAEQRDNTYITFINPVPEKGVGIFLRLALMAKKKHPEWKFLVVESRYTWEQALHHYKCDPKEFTNVTFAKHTNNVRLVYEKTKVLLAPSVWYEGFGRVAAEATLNGIPVLASRSGGLPDAVNGGGLCVDAPPKCIEDFFYVPTEKETMPWLLALEQLLEPIAYPKWEKKALESSKKHSIDVSTDTLIGYFQDMFLGKASVHPQYFIK